MRHGTINYLCVYISVNSGTGLVLTAHNNLMALLDGPFVEDNMEWRGGTPPEVAGIYCCTVEVSWTSFLGDYGGSPETDYTMEITEWKHCYCFLPGEELFKESNPDPGEENIPEDIFLGEDEDGPL